MREEPVEDPVEDAGSDEGVNVADGETIQRYELANALPEKKETLSQEKKGNLQVLSPLRHASSTMARSNDVVDETRQRRNAPNEEGNNSPPITRKLWRISVHAVEIIHIRHRHVPPSNNVIIRDEDRRHRPKEDSVAPEESQELRRRREDLPWDKSPGADDGSEQLTTDRKSTRLNSSHWS